jgi:ParB family chromosome partitioning protein
MATKRPSLGRGLEALLGNINPVDSAGTDTAVVEGPPSGTVNRAAAPRDQELARLPVDLLQRGRYQPRLDMRPETLQDLADSIRAQGVVQPIVVRPLMSQQSDEPVRYEIIAGERRWRAAQRAGLLKVPVVVRDVPEDATQQQLELALIENIQRENLNAIEESLGYQRLTDEFGLTQEQIAAAVGKDRSTVANLLRLLRLPQEIRAELSSERLTAGHARALLSLPEAADQKHVAREVISRSLSVRETEALVKRMLTPARSAAASAAALASFTLGLAL